MGPTADRPLIHCEEVAERFLFEIDRRIIHGGDNERSRLSTSISARS